MDRETALKMMIKSLEEHRARAIVVERMILEHSKYVEIKHDLWMKDADILTRRQAVERIMKEARDD